MESVQTRLSPATEELLAQASSCRYPGDAADFARQALASASDLLQTPGELQHGDALRLRVAAAVLGEVSHSHGSEAMNALCEHCIQPPPAQLRFDAARLEATTRLGRGEGVGPQIARMRAALEELTPGTTPWVDAALALATILDANCGECTVGSESFTLRERALASASVLVDASEPGSKLLLARCLNNMGRARLTSDDAEWCATTAMEEFERARRLVIGELGDSDHTILAATLSNLGCARSTADDYEGAVDALRQALEMRRRLFKEVDHPDLAVSLNNLGMETRDLPLLQEALAMLQRLHGELHPQVAASLDNVAAHTADRFASAKLRDRAREVRARWAQRDGAIDVTSGDPNYTPPGWCAVA